MKSYSNVVQVMHEQYINDRRDCRNNLEVYQAFRDHMTHQQWDEVLQFLADCYSSMNKVDKAQLQKKVQTWYNFVDSNGFQDLTYTDIVRTVTQQNKRLIKQFYSASWGLVVMAIEQFDHHECYPHKASKTMFSELFDIETVKDDNPFSKLAIGTEYANLVNLLKKQNPPTDDHPGLN